MPFQHPPSLRQTPLLLKLRLPQRHHKILLPALLPIRRRFPLSVLLLPPQRLRTLMLAPLSLALPR